MNWFECDNDGNILLNIHDIVEVLKNTDVPSIKQNQTDILTAIQNITSSGGGISPDQLNQILSAIQAIPSDTLLDNQNNMLSTLGNMDTDTSTTKNNTDGLKKMLDIINGKIEDSIIGTLKAGETFITLTSDDITENTNLDIYTSIYSVNPLSIDINNGSVTLTFKEQTEDMGVKVAFNRDVNWDNLRKYPDTSDATCINNDILSGETAYVNGNKIVGTMVNNGAKTATLNCGQSYIIPEGYHNGSGKIIANSASNQGLSNTSVTIDGSSQSGNIKLKSYSNIDVNVSILPYSLTNGSVVVYNNEIHILGSGDSGCYTNHYKYDGSTWTSVSTLPYHFYYGSAVVHNNEIHIMGGNGSSHNHYKFNGSTWTSVSTLPYGFSGGSAAILNNEIHIMGDAISDNRTVHYKFNGSTWTSVSTLPYDFYNGSSVVYNNEIHILGGDSNSTNQKHYKFNGSTWLEISMLPYEFYFGQAVVYNNEIHILGSNNSSNATKHYKFNGSTWTSVSTLPYSFYDGSSVVYNNAINILGSGGGRTKHYMIATTMYKKLN